MAHANLRILYNTFDGSADNRKLSAKAKSAWQATINALYAKCKELKGVPTNMLYFE